MKFKLLAIAAFALFTCPASNCGVLSKITSSARVAFSRPAFSRSFLSFKNFAPKAAVFTSLFAGTSKFFKPVVVKAKDNDVPELKPMFKHKNNPGVQVAYSAAILGYYLERHLKGRPNQISSEKREIYENALKFAKSIMRDECKGEIDTACRAALIFGNRVTQPDVPHSQLGLFDEVSNWETSPGRAEAAVEEALRQIYSQRFTISGINATLKLWFPSRK